MIKVNGKDIQYELAFYAYAFNDSLNPTGLGSAGIFFDYNELEVYIGIKNDVIDVITNQNANFFINLEEETVANSENLTDDAKFGDGKIVKFYINDIEVAIDVEVFRHFVYHKSAQRYAALFPLYVAKESPTFGALLKIEIPFTLGLDAEFIGYIYTKDKELLVLDKAIVDEKTLVDDVRYNIWKVKANIVPHTLRRDACVQLFEKTRTFQTNGYSDYYNHQYDTVEAVSASLDDIKFIPEKNKDALGIIREPAYANLEYDVFRAHSTVIAPGIVNKQNMTNFGVKEARSGYYDLSKGNTWLNIGYKSTDTVFSDNFYICTNPLSNIENLSNISANFTTKVNMPDEIAQIASTLGVYEKLTNAIIEAIYEKLPKTHEKANKIASEVIEKISIDKEIKDLLVDNISVSLSIPYMDYAINATPQVDTTLIFIHPMYVNAFAVHLNADNIKMFSNGMYVSPVSGHQFGFKDNRYFFKSIDKIFRNNYFRKISSNKAIYYDLLDFNIRKDFMNDENFNTIPKIISTLENNAGKYGFMYCVPTDELIKSLGDNASSESKYPLGEENIYIKVNNG